MRLIRGLDNLKKQTSAVVTIGNFDGVHLGHKKIISQLVKKAKELDAPSVLISFIPTPQSFFGNEQALLSNFKEKHRALSKLGLDIHLIIHFNQTFSKLAAQDFVQKILLDKLKMKHCLIGDDFHFGKGRKGGFKLLQDLSKINGFTVEKTPSILCDNHRVSSSKIRALLAQGELQSAAKMLGHEFFMSGKVIHGLKNGRTIGFPTINIPIKRKISPVHGIFAVIVKLEDVAHQGVCSIGNRPVIGGEKTLLEVFLFDFNQQVYGKNVAVTFKYKIRNEQEFESFGALKTQIQIDVKVAQDYFNTSIQK